LYCIIYPEINNLQSESSGTSNQATRGQFLVKNSAGEVVAQIQAQHQPLAFPIGHPPEMRDLFEAASHCLRSYQCGNSAPDLAKEMAGACEAVVRKGRGEV
jgi:hypothetical protein